MLDVWYSEASWDVSYL